MEEKKLPTPPQFMPAYAKVCPQCGFETTYKKLPPLREEEVVLGGSQADDSKRETWWDCPVCTEPVLLASRPL